MNLYPCSGGETPDWSKCKTTECRLRRHCGVKGKARKNPSERMQRK